MGLPHRNDSNRSSNKSDGGSNTANRFGHPRKKMFEPRFERGSKQKDAAQNKRRMSVSRGTSSQKSFEPRFEQKGWRFKNHKPLWTSSQKGFEPRCERGSKQKNAVRITRKMNVSRRTSFKKKFRTWFETTRWRFENGKPRGTSSQK